MALLVWHDIAVSFYPCLPWCVPMTADFCVSSAAAVGAAAAAAAPAAAPTWLCRPLLMSLCGARCSNLKHGDPSVAQRAAAASEESLSEGK